jgi:diguanylate cyclase (GGDEF)-like protein
MSDHVLQIVFGACIVAAIGALISTSSRFLRSPGNGWFAIWIGLGLLAAGAAFSVLGSYGLLNEVPVLRERPIFNAVKDYICFLGGSMFIGLGLIRRLVIATGGTPVEHLNETLAKTVKELGSSQELLSSIVRSSINGVMILKARRDDSGTVTDFECRLMNEEAENLLGHSTNTLMHRGILSYLPCIRDDGLFVEALAVLETGLPYRGEKQCSLRGKRRWYNIVAVRHGDGLVVSFADVTDRLDYERQLQHAALHDTLTGLSNRALFTQRLEDAIKRARRDGEFRFAVLFLDLDRFKIINDSLGHDVGDQLLINIARRLVSNLRESDIASRTRDGHLPARLGGDEFVILLDDIEDFDHATLVAERLQRALGEPHMIAGHEVITTASIGIVTSDGNYERPDDILRDADTAMYGAKNSGKARHVVFDERMHAEVVERLNLEKALHHALDREQFRLYYQPIVILNSGALAGFEALMRWEHPERGIVEPEHFIPLAEEIGLIVPMGAWALHEACRQLRQWQLRYPDRDNLSMNVNFSKAQLRDPRLIPMIESVIADTGIDPTRLKFEITESTFMDNAAELTPILTRIQALGIHLAMDDFGTGYSSLSFLHRAPMDYLKIDRSFISSAGKKRDYAAIIHTVVQLAHNLKMKVVAEGVETQDQLTMLQALDCNYGQGYLFDKPLDAELAEQRIRRDDRFGNIAA